jgi:cell division ATPase FtsA
MYNLKEVYCSIKIKDNYLSLVACEMKNNKTSVLFKETRMLDNILFDGLPIANGILSSNLKELIDKCNNYIANPIKAVSLILECDNFVSTTNNSSVVTFTKTGVISREDIDNSIRSNSHSPLPNHEIVYKKPYQFEVDGVSFPTIPIGSMGYQIRSKVMCYFLESKTFNSYIKLFDGISVDVIQILPASIAFVNEALGYETSQKGAIVVDFSNTSTEVSYISNGVQVKSFKTPSGFKNYIEKISNFLGVSFDEAKSFNELLVYNSYDLDETIKRTFTGYYGNWVNLTMSDLINESRNMMNNLFVNILNSINVDQTIKRSEVSKDAINFECKKIYLTGKILEIDGICEMLNESLTKIYNVSFHKYESKIIGIDNQELVAAIGACYIWFLENKEVVDKQYAIDSFVSREIESIHEKRRRLYFLTQLSYKIVQKITR